MKKQEGITLVALIVTIIVLMILAGASIGMLSGENGLITKTQKGVGTYQNSEAKEDELMGDLGNLINEYVGKAETAGGSQNSQTPAEPNEPQEPATTYTVTYYVGSGTGAPASAELESGATISTTVPTWSGHTFQGWALASAPNTKVYDPGDQINLTGDTELIAVWSGINTVTPEMIIANKSAYYGKEVTNYTAGNKTYRIFYVDEEVSNGMGKYGPANTIYLKADWTANDVILSDYVNSSYTPNTTEILARMNPSWWSNRGTSSASWNLNERSAAYLCNPTGVNPTTKVAYAGTTWSSYYDSNKADYVIGSPSVEMYVASYNDVTHTTGNYTLGATYRATDYPGYIYTINGAQSSSNSDYYTAENTLDYSTTYHNMYCGKDGEQGSYYTWLASPSSGYRSSVCDVCGNYLHSYAYGSNLGVSPLVSLKSDFLPEIATGT